MPKKGTKILYRRQRTSYSCSHCRHDKIKCDRQLPCQSCYDRDREGECSYPAGAKNSRQQRKQKKLSKSFEMVSESNSNEEILMNDFFTNESETMIEVQMMPETYSRSSISSRSSIFTPSNRIIESLSTSETNLSPHSQMQSISTAPTMHSTPAKSPFNNSTPANEKITFQPFNHHHQQSQNDSIGTDSTTVALDGTDISVPSMALHGTPFTNVRNNSMITFLENKIEIPAIPTRLAKGFFEDYMEFYGEILQLLPSEELRKNIEEYCLTFATDSPIITQNKGSLGSWKANRTDGCALGSLMQVLLVLSIGANNHAASLQAIDRIRDETMIRVYDSLANERKLGLKDIHARSWLKTSFALEISAELYSIARLIAVAQEGYAPTRESIRNMRLLAWANYNHNPWMSFDMANKALTSALTIKMDLIALDWSKMNQTSEGITEDEKETRKIFISCATFDRNIFRFKRILHSKPLAEILTIKKYAKHNPNLAQYLFYDQIAGDITNLPSFDSILWQGNQKNEIEKIREITQSIEWKLKEVKESISALKPFPIDEQSCVQADNDLMTPIMRVYACIQWTFFRLLTHRPFLNVAATQGININQSIRQDVVNAIEISSETIIDFIDCFNFAISFSDAFHKSSMGAVVTLQRTSFALFLCLVATQNQFKEQFSQETRIKWYQTIKKTADLVEEYMSNGDFLPHIRKTYDQIKSIQSISESLLPLGWSHSDCANNNLASDEVDDMANLDINGVLSKEILGPCLVHDNEGSFSWEEADDPDFLLDMLKRDNVF